MIKPKLNVKQVIKQVCSWLCVREKGKASLFPLCFIVSQGDHFCLSLLVSHLLFFCWLERLMILSKLPLTT